MHSHLRHKNNDVQYNPFIGAQIPNSSIQSDRLLEFIQDIKILYFYLNRVSIQWILWKLYNNTFNWKKYLKKFTACSVGHSVHYIRVLNL